MYTFTYLRNEFDFWNVHGIINTSGLLQETRSIHNSMNRPKLNLFLIFTFYYKYLKIEKIGNKTVFFYLICNRNNGFVGV